MSIRRVRIGGLCAAPVILGSLVLMRCESALVSATLSWDLLESDGVFLYYGDEVDSYGLNRIAKVSLSNGSQTVLAARPRSETPSAFTSDDTNIYWSTSAGEILRVPHAGGVVSQVATNATTVGPLAVDAHSIYWFGVSPSAQGISLLKVSKDGGATVVVAESAAVAPTAMSVNSTEVFWTDWGDYGGLNRLGGPANRGSVVSVPIGGGQTTNLAVDQAYPGGIVVDDTMLYWLNQGNDVLGTRGTITSMPLATRNASVILSSQTQYRACTLYPCGAHNKLREDQEFLYWNDDTSIRRIAKSGVGTAEAIVDYGQDSIYIRIFAVDTVKMYWSDGVSIHGVPK